LSLKHCEEILSIVPVDLTLGEIVGCGVLRGATLGVLIDATVDSDTNIGRLDGLIVTSL
jgi:hypothetical protein